MILCLNDPISFVVCSRPKLVSRSGFNRSGSITEYCI